MQSKTSLFNPTLFRKNLTRFWPIWAVYGVIWVLALPGDLLSEYLNGYMQPEFAQGNVDSLVMDVASTVGIALAFGFGCIAALAVFSYLYQHRSAVAMHTFPLRRECLFVTNYLSGLAFFVLPLAVVFVLTLGVEGIIGAVNVSGLLVWFTAQVGYVLFFYSFAVFCAMFTGNAFAMPCFYGILSVLAPAMALMADSSFRKFIYGYSSSGRMNDIATILSPILNLYEQVHQVDRVLDDGTVLYYMSGWGWIILYALAGVALAVTALLVYRRRQVESAGDVVSVALVRPLFQYGVAVCSALTFGTLLFDALFDSTSPYSAGIMLVLLVLCGGVGYFVAQMLLDKSFRGFARRWKGFLGLSLALVAAVGIVYFDPFQLVYTIPPADQVASVSLTSAYTFPDGRDSYWDIQDPEIIRQVLDLQKTVIDQRNETQRKIRQYEREGEPEQNRYELGNGDWTYVNNTSGYYFRIEYSLTSGRETERTYTIYVSSEELADPDSPAAKLTALLNACARLEDPFGESTETQVVRAEVMIQDQTRDWETVTLDQDEARTLYRAVRSDWEDGTLGQCWLIQNQEYLENNYTPTIEFSVTYKDEKGNSQLSTYSITPQVGAQATVNALQELGVVDEDHPLLTGLERRILEATAPGS